MSQWLERLWYPEGGESLLRRWTLAPLLWLSWGWRAVISFRNWLFDCGALKAVRIKGTRIISVGNINAGGAGKTPVVIHLAQLAQDRGKKVVVLSRGYGRKGKSVEIFSSENCPSAEVVGDEPVLIAKSCPGVLVMVGPHRAALAAWAKEHLKPDVILLDDGFQHRRLARDVDVVVVDAQAGFGNGQLIPRGPLREPETALARADLLVFRDAVGVSPRTFLKKKFVWGRFEVSTLLDGSGKVLPAERLRGQRVLAVCALARPRAFFRTLDALGAHLVEQHAFPDHEFLQDETCVRIAQRASNVGAIVVTTEKDYVRWPQGAEKPWVIGMRLRPVSGQEHLENLFSASPKRG